ncbi:hypothetical protein SAMN05216430_104169 [Limosilactobacillus mucosae]|nr:hypothetical protein SAMN05216430_104169 [Limosilactobacillus mucosae]SEK75630.1 hypothetical protein SAMN05216545_104168 [Limosilactobacillus mucosae]SFK05202.1 hypothetical protein SAMN05216461_1042 [Limosilactobacillus mucosae]
MAPSAIVLTIIILVLVIIIVQAVRSRISAF